MFTYLSYNDVLQKKLEVMDNTAITLCMNNKIPIMVLISTFREILSKPVKVKT